MRRLLPFSCALLLIPALCSAQCSEKNDHRSNKNGGFLVSDVRLSGITTMSTGDVLSIAAQFEGSCFNDDSEELQERLRAEFQNRGYMAVEVKSFRLKPLDTLGNPQPADFEAEISEGQRYRLLRLEFTGNHAISSTRLRELFPLKKGDIFAREKVANGIEKLRRSYGSLGYLDFFSIPDIPVSSDGRVTLAMTVHEGKQYHMGSLHIQAKKEVAEKLQEKWRLSEGRIFDNHYLSKFVNDNRALLPEGFSSEGGVSTIRDCDDASVQVLLRVDISQPVPSMAPEKRCNENPGSAPSNM